MDKDTLENITNAISNGRTDIVRTLVTICEKGDGQVEGINNSLTSDVLLNSLSSQHGSLLHLATKLDHVDIVRTLLSAGADPSVQNGDGETPYDLVLTDRMRSVYVEELLKCSARSDVQRMHQLIASGICVDSQDSPLSGNTALHWAASYGTADAVQCLLDHGASVNITNADGATPLHDAVNRRDIQVIQKLLSAGADPMLKCSEGKYKNKRPIDLASSDKEISELVLSYLTPSNSKQKNSNGTISITSSSLESLRAENGFVESVSHLSLDSPMKHSMSSYVSQSSTLPPFPLLSSPPPLITDTRLHLLWPLPHQIVQNDGSLFKLKEKYSVCVVHDGDEALVKRVINMWKNHSENFFLLNIQCLVEDVMSSSVTPCGSLICHVNKKLFDKKQCYKIIITSDQLRVLASDEFGLHYGICTLLQLFKLYQGEDGIPPLYIEDWPVLQYRGVLLDMAPVARKPTVDTLKGHIKIFSTLKLNQIHFYFRYQPKGGDKWPYCNSDLIQLVEFCHQHYLVPIPAIDVSSEISFGDLNGYSTHILHLMSLFSSREIHIGPNLSNMILDTLAKESNASVWDALSIPSNCLVYLCANGFSMNTKVLRVMPLNTVYIEYGYQAEYDYDSSIKTVVFSGSPVFVGVGSSSWGSIAGCPETATNNIYKASQSSVFHGALGMIIADWKTMPHHSALCFSWPGILLAAGLSWNSSIHLDFLHTRLPELLNHYVFLDSEQIMGYLNVELGRLEAFVHRTAQSQKVCTLQQRPVSSSVLHQFLVDPDNVLMDHFTLDLLQQAVRHIKKFEFDLKKAKPECFQKGEVVAEVQLAIDLQLFACKLAKVMLSNGLNPSPSAGFTNIANVGVSNLPPIAKTDLANRLLALVEQFRGVWLSRNLPCGLHESLYLFNALLHKLIPNSEHFFASADGFVRQ